MTKLDTRHLKIPPNILNSWQSVVGVLAETARLSVSLMMQMPNKQMRVLCSNRLSEVLFQQDEIININDHAWIEPIIDSSRILKTSLTQQHYHQSKRFTFALPTLSPTVDNYCGVPVYWPNGDLFGVIGLFNTPTQHDQAITQKLFDSFVLAVESQLGSHFHSEKLAAMNRDLQAKVDNRTQDLAKLNFSLTEEINKRISAEQQMSYQINHDIGTGFLNRKSLKEKLTTWLTQQQPDPRKIILIHIGFANAQRVQAKYGYRALDQLLLNYRDELHSLNELDSLTARISTTGLLLAIFTHDIESVIDKVCNNLIEVGHSEFPIHNELAHLHAFIGIATSDDSQCAGTLLQYANEAMLACKDSGQKFSLFSQSLADNITHINQLENYLLQAVRNDDLLLYFQPKVDPQTRRWLGAEALLRWKHPILGDVSNENLIHMAEQNGLIFEVGSFVLRAAIEKAKEWSDLSSNFRMAVNISAVQLKNVQFAEQVKHLLDTYHLAPQHLELEVTESCIIADEALALNSLEALHELGITLSLDDFGTGYASFSYLKKFPFDYIKIDRSFVHQIDQSHEDAEIVRSIIQVAKKMQIKTVVEGIEHKEHENFILEQQCDVGQGYFYGKPMPGHEFEQYLIDQNYLDPPNFIYQG